MKNLFQANQCSQLICDTKVNANATSYEELKAGWYSFEKTMLHPDAMIIDVLPGTKCGSNAVR